MIKRFKKKPVIIEALKFTGSNKNFQELEIFIGDKATSSHSTNFKPSLIIDTLEGKHEAREGDWIIKGIKGEFYPCKPDIFKQMYEEVKQ